MILACLVLFLSLFPLSESFPPTCSQLPPSKINDEYCDCGFDESLTSACSSSSFTCPHERTPIPSSRVQDGVCDCCDGADESPSRNCPDDCERLDAERKETERSRKEGEEEGGKVLVGMLEKVHAQRCEALSGGGDVGVVEEGLRVAREEVKAAEAEEEGNMIKERIRSLGLDRVDGDALSRILVEFASEAIKRKMHGEEEERDEDHPEVQAGGLGVKLERLVAEVMEPCKSDEVDCVDEPVWVETPQESARAIELKVRIKELEERLRVVKEYDDGADYGPGQVWRALKGECFEFTKEPYKYKFCPFDTFHQDHVLLGTFTKFDSQRNLMRFENGQMCFSPAAPRVITAKLECGMNTEILDISEPSTCEYEARISSPAACVPKSLPVQECPAVAAAA